MDARESTLTMPDFPIALPKPPPLLIVVSGPSGVGKDVTVKRMKERGAPFHFLVTNTTRPKRENEIADVDYHFVTVEEFNRKLATGEFLEHACVYEHLYGNSKREIQQALTRGEDVILRIDVQGAKTIRQKVEGALLIFMVASLDELEQRLRARKSETSDSLQLRLEMAVKEMQEFDLFDYVVVNRDSHLDQTVDDILAIIRAEKLKTDPRQVRFLS